MFSMWASTMPSDLDINSLGLEVGGLIVGWVFLFAIVTVLGFVAEALFKKRRAQRGDKGNLGKTVFTFAVVFSLAALIGML